MMHVAGRNLYIESVECLVAIGFGCVDESAQDIPEIHF